MDKGGKPSSLRALDDRLNKARGAIEAKTGRDRGGEAKALSRAWMVALEMVTAIAVSTAIGWYLDRVFDTGKVLLVVFFFFGVGAGILNVYRGAKRMEQEARAPAAKEAERGDT